ncbi:MAG: aldo/keto reductase [Candidatus Marinimicrobia bacterium CG08_land_8_20_14_0_20_45_22]|nr:MAG: aldo/keto reductase [Candidatus Marinimicrobia bacterium CG08_land_8_20_14_0_20_45_22]
MQYVKLGKKGPTVSSIGFGAWAIGGLNWGKTDDDVSRNALRKALDSGVTLIDTADNYGYGHSEELIGGVLKERGKGRVIVSTKAGNDFYHAKAEDDAGYGPIRQNTDKNYIIFAAEQSLKRLGFEALDVLQLHSPNIENLDRDEPWSALLQLKKDGKIIHSGWSVQSFKETDQAFILDQYNEAIDVIQVRYNLLEREAEKVLFPKALKYGIGVIARIPILFGLLTGKFNRDSRFGEDDHRRMNLSPEKLDDYLLKLDQMKPLFVRYPDQTMSQVALRFCLSHPACQTAIPGAKTTMQVKDNCAASDFGKIPIEEIPALA